MLRFLADENFNNQIIRGVLRRNSNVDIAVLAWVQYSFDLSPNLSPQRREALNLTPQR
ncbi:hypothetical protein [Nostoc sp. C057]|uniref:hypothetical protein n=1 Tax=Nostoc sp. C057 TaxID=2576903 RepID=UPI0015C33E6A|nr:hypothetical protein [Nostoc sp. C057]